jgi:hypothetical protein
MTMAWPEDSRLQALAAFLIVRGPYAWVGYGFIGAFWMSCRAFC